MDIPNDFWNPLFSPVQVSSDPSMMVEPSEKIVTWDDYSQYMGKVKDVPNHQPE